MLMSETKKIEITPSVSILIAGVLIAGAILFTSNKAPAVEGDAPTAAAEVRPPSATDHLRGSADAPIVLVEYSDFQCPYCNVIHPTLKKIVEESNGQIAWVYRQLPLTSIHPEAQPAAEASECVAEQLGSGGFWQFADILFANQAKLGSAYYAEVAKGLGADPAKFAACAASGKYADKIATDTTEAQSNGGSGTPFTVVLNTKTGKGMPISGALPYAQIMSVIKSVQ